MEGVAGHVGARGVGGMGPARTLVPEFVASGWRHRGLIGRLTRRALGDRYRGTLLGGAWAVLTPMLLLGAYTVVFGVFLGARDSVPGLGGTAEYALWLFAGLMVFRLVSESMNDATGLVRRHRNLVTRVVFPLEALAWVRVGRGVVEALVGLMVVVVFAAVVRGGVEWTAPLVVLPVSVAAVWALALTWLVSGAGVYVRDLGPVVATGTLVAMFLSCVFYPVERVPESWRWAMEWNPAAAVLESVRAALFGTGRLRVGAMGVLLAAGLVACWVGHAWFGRVKGGFADVL